MIGFLRLTPLTRQNFTLQLDLLLLLIGNPLLQLRSGTESKLLGL